MSATRHIASGLEHFTVSTVPDLAVWRRGHDGPLIVAIHGGLDRGGSFARMARRLEGCEFITYDRRGYQGSRAGGTANLHQHARDLVNLVHGVVSETPPVVVGHSYGGLVALAASLLEPTLITSVVTYEPPLPWVYRREGTMSPLTGTPEDEAERFFRRMISDVAWDRLADDEKAGRRADGPALYDDLATLRNPTPPFSIESITAHWTYSFGNADERHAYYVEVARRLGVLVPSVTIAPLEGAGHGAHLANPEGLAKIIRRHMEEQ
ncbi:MAG: alpha/beta hydrolase [Acidobacteria bacterium]|nr:alpha/beta hydrolase [Acidobacteriota bacterium]